MASSIVVTRKKRGRPSSGGADPITPVRMPEDLRNALDLWINQQPSPQPSRSEAIRLALKDWLTGLGLLHHRDDPEGAN